MPPVAWPPPLAVSTAVFAGALDDAQWDALDASGVQAVEIVGPSPRLPLDDPDCFRRSEVRLRRARVRLHSVHLPYGRALDLSQPDADAREAALATTARNLRLAAALGAPLVVVHPSAEPIPDAERGARLDAARRSLAALARAAADDGVRVAVECLPRTCLGNTAAELRAIVDALDPAAAGVCLDVNHLNLREPDLGAAVAALAPRLLTLHCSDNDGVDERHWLPGAAGGVVDWTAFLSALRAGGYAGPFLYEVRAPDPDPAAALRAVEDNFRRLLATHASA
jgi:sugar phosphate isomerase/epimerase